MTFYLNLIFQKQYLVSMILFQYIKHVLLTMQFHSFRIYKEIVSYGMYRYILVKHLLTKYQISLLKILIANGCVSLFQVNSELSASVRSTSSELHLPPPEYNRTESTGSCKERKDPARTKKKSAWYSVLYPTYKSRSEDYKKIFKDVPDDERLVVGR